ncbi:hypothetical protein OUZ56_012648 [Daphnia magna]|uniref:Uncharacterized protein n=1 Tax=Daphnia magna TaxID=35525 RepID=A0ABQ9Z3M9_9CRUS|nr:hypothetical protein OUZ56_012648 [Daphnia magna]
MYAITLILETAFRWSVEEKRIFRRDFYEAIYHDVFLQKLSLVDCPLHEKDCIADVIEHYMEVRFCCLAQREQELQTEKLANGSRNKRKQTKLMTTKPQKTVNLTRFAKKTENSGFFIRAHVKVVISFEAPPLGGATYAELCFRGPMARCRTSFLLR